MFAIIMTHPFLNSSPFHWLIFAGNTKSKSKSSLHYSIGKKHSISYLVLFDFMTNPTNPHIQAISILKIIPPYSALDLHYYLMQNSVGGGVCFFQPCPNFNLSCKLKLPKKGICSGHNFNCKPLQVSRKMVLFPLAPPIFGFETWALNSKWTFHESFLRHNTKCPFDNSMV